MNNKITIAVDGYSSTGKSTLAKELAKHLSYIYVDSGAMYRCVALYAVQANLYNPDLNKAELVKQLDRVTISFKYDEISKQNRTFLNGKDVEDEIRTLKVSNKVSEVAAIPDVRKHLVKIQKALGKNKGVVMDGRDIGTVVFPDAELKIFMTADPNIRAKRRFEELTAKGEKVNFKAVLANLTTRDADDTSRADSPLIQAADALVLDNSNLSRQEQFKIAVDWATKAINSKN